MGTYSCDDVNSSQIAAGHITWEACTAAQGWYSTTWQLCIAVQRAEPGAHLCIRGQSPAHAQFAGAAQQRLAVGISLRHPTSHHCTLFHNWRLHHRRML